MEDHDVMRVIEVFSQCVDVLASQSIGHEDGGPVSVSPIYSILSERRKNHTTAVFNQTTEFNINKTS